MFNSKLYITLIIILICNCTNNTQSEPVEEKNYLFNIKDSTVNNYYIGQKIESQKTEDGLIIYSSMGEVFLIYTKNKKYKFESNDFKIGDSIAEVIKVFGEGEQNKKDAMLLGAYAYSYEGVVFTTDKKEGVINGIGIWGYNK